MAKKPDIKQKQYCNKFNKDFKNGPHPKKRERERERERGRKAEWKRSSGERM